VYRVATKVAAHAALASRHPRFAVAAHLAHLLAAAQDDGAGGDGGAGLVEWLANLGSVRVALNSINLGANDS
jgi:hypothetical protein